MATSNQAGRPPSGSETVTTQSSPLDRAHLSRHTFGDLGLEREVLDLFRTQSLIYLSRVKAARSDIEWRDAVHSLKGSARAIGAWRIAEAAERAEAGNPSSRAASIAKIESSLREVNTFIGTLLEADPPTS
ncbi:MAG TPA: Hpt domain-containing protein [Methyloceanibacter sp.]|jgi:HPt (histidine-containing phosphotransfer) domain-containing protein|nr:Hpt domain-containing protein [Methyloceanibacter sp.]